MSKFITLAKSLQQLLIGGAVLAFGLIWPFLSTAQQKADQAKNSNPHAQHQEKPPAGQMQGMKMQGMSGQKQDSSWWFDNYTRGQKHDMGGKDMAHGEGGMAGMTGMIKGNMEASSLTGDGSSSGTGITSDVDLMGMMDDDRGLMGAVAIGGAGSKSMIGMDEMKTASSLPGIPGVSHMYHIGATGFFLNHSEHITLSIKQQAALNVVQRKALLTMFTARRKIEEAEQELWELTGADEPDASQIQTTVQAIETLRGQQRRAFIQSVGEAAKVLTDEQRQMLLGTKKPDASGASDH